MFFENLDGNETRLRQGVKKDRQIPDSVGGDVQPKVKRRRLDKPRLVKATPCSTEQNLI